jgi:DNA-binding transcriptional MerR regulator
MVPKKHSNGDLTYSIGQVAKFADLPQSVLRYWETVFESLSPAKTPGGSRQYSDEDVKTILRIKELLYVQGFTIKGANHQLQDESTDRTQKNDPVLPDNPQKKTELDLKEIVKELKKIIKILDE